METITAIESIVPQKYHGLILLGVGLTPYITRGIFAFTNGANFRGVIAAIFFGTNTPKPTVPVETPKQNP